MFSSFFLHLRWRSGPKGRGGEAKTRSLFILFSFFLHFIFIDSFYFHVFFIFSSFYFHFFFIVAISKEIRRSPKQSGGIISWDHIKTRERRTCPSLLSLLKPAILHSSFHSEGDKKATAVFPCSGCCLRARVLRPEPGDSRALNAAARPKVAMATS